MTKFINKIRLALKTVLIVFFAIFLTSCEEDKLEYKLPFYFATIEANKLVYISNLNAKLMDKNNKTVQEVKSDADGVVEVLLYTGSVNHAEKNKIDEELLLKKFNDEYKLEVSDPSGKYKATTIEKTSLSNLIILEKI